MMYRSPSRRRPHPVTAFEPLEPRILATAVLFDRLDHARPIMPSTIYDTAGRRVRPVAPALPQAPENDQSLIPPALPGATQTVNVTLGGATGNNAAPLGVNVGEMTEWAQGNTIDDLITSGGSFERGTGRILVHVSNVPASPLNQIVVDADWVWAQLGMNTAIGQQLVGSTGANMNGAWTISNMTPQYDSSGNTTGRVVITLASNLWTAPVYGDTFYVQIKNDNNLPLADQISGWGNYTVARDNSLAYAGSSSAAIAFGAGPAQNNFAALQFYLGASDQAGRNVLQQGHTYQLSIFAITTTAATGNLSLYQGQNGGGITFALIPDGKWHQYTLTVTATNPVLYQNGVITVGFNGANGAVHVDVVRLTDLTDQISPASPLSKTIESLITTYGFSQLRFWHPSIRFADLNSVIGPADARPMLVGPFNTYDPQFGLPEMLQLAKDTSTVPWIVLPTTWSAQEIHDLMEYLAGPVTSTYGAIRAADGHPASWFADLPAIRFEAGNESWNATFYPNAYVPFQGYFDRAENMFEAFKSDPLYASVGSKITLIVNGWQWVPWYTQLAVQLTPAADAVDVSAYTGGPNTEMPLNDLLGGALTEPISEDASDYPKTIFGKPVFVYEEAPGELNNTLTAQTESDYATSLGAALTVAHNSMLLARDYGISNQNLFTLVQRGDNTPEGFALGHYGLFADMTTAGTNPRPTALAAELLNRASGKIVSTTLSNGWVVDSSSTQTAATTTQAADAMVTVSSTKLTITFFNDTVQDGQNTLFHLLLPAVLAGQALNLNWNAATFQVLSGPSVSSNNESTQTVKISNGSFAHGASELYAALPAHSMGSLVIPLT
ncbi:MAG TPA: hypothetical protein VH253_16185 [Phycisphaerae bacterium]|nr:hypothetical protein [Phycisphaerae bacterium]